MSLTSFLLGANTCSKKRAIDTELDAIFNSQAADSEVRRPSDSPKVAAKKKRRSDVHTDEPERKRRKSDSHPKEKKTRVRISSEPGTSDEEEPECPDGVSVHGSASGSLNDVVEDTDPALIHETLQQNKTGKGKPAGRKAKNTPSDETKERRDARTIFIGNLAPDVAIKRPLQKQLHRHILTFAPTAKIESTRFRSIAFQNPTSKLSEGGDEGAKRKQLRQHERDRASLWRDANSAGGLRTDEKMFLTPSQKKKIAFINKDIHSNGDSVHAYVVFGYPAPHSRPANLPLLPPVMDPFEAARLVIEKCNGSVFLERMLRVDAVVKQSTVASLSDNALPSLVTGDPKLSIFVGNLDFASKEEDLRVFFEGVVSVERGPPEADDNGPKSWVTRVRMVRDKDTQLGKGFAYVQFSDRTCVDEILALGPGKLKFAKRKLRVQRCKLTMNPPSGKTAAPSKPGKSPQTFNHTPVPTIPKGDPSLGDKLVKLTKEERKRVKTTDADRVARRMAKKKARIALAKQGIPVQGKQRERVRKTNVAKTFGGASVKKASKGRVRSEKSIARRNMKK